MGERNWAGNVEFEAKRVVRPQSIDELQSLVAKAAAGGERVHALGARHSFNRVADTGGVLIITDGLDQITTIEPSASTVTVEGGARYATVAAELHAQGLALANLPSLPHVTVAGAIATATHGSGDRNQNLAAAVASIDLVGADGELTRVRDGDPHFGGVPVGLGALGIVARVELKVEPTFDVAQRLYRHLPFDTAVANLNEILSSGYSVSLFTDWSGDRFDQVWLKRRADGQVHFPDDLFGAPQAEVPLHPIESVPADACTEQLGRPGPWHERLPHFRPDFTPSVGEELQTEYLVDRSAGADAITALRSLATPISQLVLVNEIRSVAADDLWLSTAYGRDSIAIHFTWRPDQPAVTELLPKLESALAPFAPRPHWGKLTTIEPEVIRSRYPRFADFSELVHDLDPQHTFRNDFLDDLIE